MRTKTPATFEVRKQPEIFHFGLGHAQAIEGRKAAMEGESFAHGVPVARDEALEAFGSESAGAGLLGLPHRLCRLEQDLAHGERPRLPVDVDQRLKFAQVMGVAERVVDICEGGVGAKMVMDDDPALQRLGNVAASRSDAIEGVALARGRMKCRSLYLI